MTDTTNAPPAPSSGPRRDRSWRLVLAAVAVAATTPYVTLKALWLADVPVGLRGDALTDSGVMAAANGATLVMELVAAALAVAFVLPAGRRLPGLLVQLPMAVGTGLLGGILVFVPIQLALSAFRPLPEATPPPSGIEDWVYALVYGGFVVLGLTLLTLYAGYVWDRWGRPAGWDAPLARWAPTARRTVDLVAAVGLVALCGAALPASLDATGVVTAHPLGMLLLAGIAAAGQAALLSRRPRRLPGVVALLAAWLGTTAVAAWSTYLCVLSLVPNPLRGDTPVPALLVGLELACAVCAGWLVVRLHAGHGAPGRHSEQGVPGRRSDHGAPDR